MDALMITTERCRVRLFEARDIDAFTDYRNNAAWMQFQTFKGLGREVYRDKLLRPQIPEQGMQLAIAEVAKDTLMGDLYLARKGKTLTVGFTIRPEYARRGIMLEVMRAFLPALTQVWPGSEIVAMTDRNNIPSKSLLGRLGFVYDSWIEAWESEVYILKD